MIETTSVGTTTTRATKTAGEPRRLDRIYKAPPVHWVGDGFRVSGIFSAIPQAARQLSPFLLLDYHPEHTYAPTDTPRGVGVHPHRGFETVTIAWQGSVAHHDSAGGGGVIGPGDVQWMTAASGILHKEYHEAGWARGGGPFQMAQLWVNLPRAHKMAAPRYQGITSDAIGVATLPDEAGTVRVIAGEYRGVKGPALTFTPIGVFDAHVRAGGRADFAIPAQHNLGILVVGGEVTIQGERARAGDFAVFENVGEALAIEATTDAHVLVLSGEPIDEPIVQYGPFVMNTKDEIVQAFVDFEDGRFGVLED